MPLTIWELRAITRRPNEPGKLLVVECRSVFNPAQRAAAEAFQGAGGRVIAANENADWVRQVERALEKPSLVLRGPPTLRGILRDQPGRTIIHLLNLNVERVSSFEDKIHPASGVTLGCRVPFARVRSVRALTADESADRGALKFTAKPEGNGAFVELAPGRIEIATMLIVER